MTDGSFESTYQDQIVPVDGEFGEFWRKAELVGSRDPARHAAAMARTTVGFFYQGEAGVTQAENPCGLEPVDIVTTNEADEEVHGDRSPTYWLDVKEVLSGTPEDIARSLKYRMQPEIIAEVMQNGGKIIIDRSGRCRAIDGTDVILSSEESATDHPN